MPTTTIKLVNNELVLSVVDEPKEEGGPKYCSLYVFAPHYVLVTGSYDHTFVGPFLSFSQALAWAKLNQTKFVTRIMDQSGMEDNIKQFGDCALCLPDDFIQSLKEETPQASQDSQDLDTNQLISDLHAVGLRVITFE